jgi:hypothetical protein
MQATRSCSRSNTKEKTRDQRSSSSSCKYSHKSQVTNTRKFFSISSLKGLLSTFQIGLSSNGNRHWTKCPLTNRQKSMKRLNDDKRHRGHQSQQTSSLANMKAQTNSTG